MEHKEVKLKFSSDKTSTNLVRKFGVTSSFSVVSYQVQMTGPLCPHSIQSLGSCALGTVQPLALWISVAGTYISPEGAESW